MVLWLVARMLKKWVESAQAYLGTVIKMCLLPELVGAVEKELSFTVCLNLSCGNGIP